MNNNFCRYISLLGLLLLLSLQLKAQNPSLSVNYFGLQDCAGTPIEVPIVADQFDNVVQLQFSMAWDPSLLSLINVSNINPQIASQDPIIQVDGVNGVLTFTMNAATDQTISAGATLFTIYFDLAGNGNNILNIDFGDVPVPRFATTLVDGVGEPQEQTPQLFGTTITVFDNVGPIVNCPSQQTLFVEAGQCSIENVAFDFPIVEDFCDPEVALAGATHTSPSTFSVGENQVSFLYQDASGNNGSCSFLISVLDTFAPVFTNAILDTAIIYTDGTIVANPNNIIVNSSLVSCSAIQLFLDWQLTATDNCSSNPLVLQTNTESSGDVFDAGLHEFTFQSTDSSGNSAQTTAYILVLPTTLQLDVIANAVPCSGTTIQLSATNATPDLTYQWSGPNEFSSEETSPSILVSPTTVGTYQVTITNSIQCSTVVFYNIASVETPVIDIPNTNINCLGGLHIEPSANIENLSWLWTAPDLSNTFTQNYNNPTANVSNAGLYTVVACNQGVCCDTNAVNIEAISTLPLVALLPSDTSICLGDTITIQATVSPDVDLLWSANPSENAGFPSNIFQSILEISPTSAGTYTYTLNTALGACASEPVEVTLTVNQLSFEVPTVSGLDDCETIGSNITLSTNNQNIETWNWQGPDNYSATTNPASINVQNLSQTGTYTIIAIDANGCSDTSEVAIAYNIAPNAPIIVYGGDVNSNPNAGQPGEPDIFACPNSDILLTTFANPENQYLWVGPNLNNEADSVFLNNFNSSQSGIYTLYALSNSCISPATNAIISYIAVPEAQDDQFTIESQVSPTFIFVNGNDVSIQGQPANWSLLSQPNPGFIDDQPDPGVFNFVNDTTYGGFVTFQYLLCSDYCPESCDTATVTIEQLIPCLIPNVITPNGDGANDVLIISCLQIETRFPDNELFLYNEWGDVIYNAQPYKNDWTGTNNNSQNLPDGTYFYIFRESAEFEWKKGFVMVMRGDK